MVSFNFQASYSKLWWPNHTLFSILLSKLVTIDMIEICKSTKQINNSISINNVLDNANLLVLLLLVITYFCQKESLWKCLAADLNEYYAIILLQN